MTFNAPINDAQLLDLAKKAYEEMAGQFETCILDGQPLDESYRPSVMTALLGPSRQTVILASSMKKLEDNWAKWTILKTTPS